MQISVSFYDQPSKVESINVIEKVAEGKFSVYSVHSPRHGANFALKVFPKNVPGTDQYEKEMLASELKHCNVIRQIPLVCRDSRFHALMSEFAKHGDFFEFVTGGSMDNETLMRTYFHQLIGGLEYIHSRGIGHLDLKLENIMIGSKYQLKIIDFDQAQLLTDDTMTSGGTQGYRAPEILAGDCNDYKAADIYSAGVILYTFKAKEFPFLETEDLEGRDVRCYSTYMKNPRAFWRTKSDGKERGFFSNDFMTLVDGMVCEDPKKRLTIKEIKKSNWYNGPTFSQEQLMVEMKARLRKVAN